MEVIDTVRRLGYHPSIVLWSGNNENQVLTIVYSLHWDKGISLIACKLIKDKVFKFLNFFVCSLFQGFCKKTADYIDYSLLYDSTIRATLWEEVRSNYTFNTH